MYRILLTILKQEPSQSPTSVQPIQALSGRHFTVLARFVKCQTAISRVAPNTAPFYIVPLCSRNPWKLIRAISQVTLRGDHHCLHIGQFPARSNLQLRSPEPFTGCMVVILADVECIAGLVVVVYVHHQITAFQ